LQFSPIFCPNCRWVPKSIFFPVLAAYKRTVTVQFRERSIQCHPHHTNKIQHSLSNSVESKSQIQKIFKNIQTLTVFPELEFNTEATKFAKFSVIHTESSSPNLSPPQSKCEFAAVDGKLRARSRWDRIRRREEEEERKLLVYPWIQAKEATNRSESKSVRRFRFKSPIKTQVKHINIPLFHSRTHIDPESM